ncbi:hypothetical protein KCP70_24640 [Salmonella enterica subsp. enterica]|nr:hypothetical protein KCP70_24640 [Salmonella enterica subsp. enterica]
MIWRWRPTQNFIREIFTGAYASDFGVWDTNVGEETIRHQHRIGAEARDMKTLFNIVPEAAVCIWETGMSVQLRNRPYLTITPDALCVSGLTASARTDSAILKRVKTVPDTVVLANIPGCVWKTSAALRADGCVTATTFKDGVFANCRRARVARFMEKKYATYPTIKWG